VVPPPDDLASIKTPLWTAAFFIVGLKTNQHFCGEWCSRSSFSLSAGSESMIAEGASALLQFKPEGPPGSLFTNIASIVTSELPYFPQSHHGKQTTFVIPYEIKNR
jgi:hypothetical protein